MIFKNMNKRKRSGLRFNARMQYPNTTTFKQWTQTAKDRPLDSGDFVNLIRMRCPSQSMICFGTGAIVNGVDDRGVLQMQLKDASGNDIKGVLRLFVTDAAFLSTNIIFEDRMERLTESDIRSAFRLADTNAFARQDSHLAMSFRADPADHDKIIDFDQSVALIPVTTLVL